MKMYWLCYLLFCSALGFAADRPVFIKMGGYSRLLWGRSIYQEFLPGKWERDNLALLDVPVFRGYQNDRTFFDGFSVYKVLIPNVGLNNRRVIEGHQVTRKGKNIWEWSFPVELPDKSWVLAAANGKILIRQNVDSNSDGTDKIQKIEPFVRLAILDIDRKSIETIDEIHRAPSLVQVISTIIEGDIFIILNTGKISVLRHETNSIQVITDSFWKEFDLPVVLDAFHVPHHDTDIPYAPPFVTYPFFDHATNIYFGVQPFLKFQTTAEFLEKEFENASDHFRSMQDFDKFKKIIKTRDKWTWYSKRFFVFSMDYINGRISMVEDERFQHLASKDSEPGSMKWPILKDADSEPNQSRDMCVDSDEKVQFFSIDDLVNSQPPKKVLKQEKE